MNGFYGEVGIFHAFSGFVGEEDVGRDDGGEVVEVHLGAGLLVHDREGGGPIQEGEEYLHCVPMCFGEETT